LIELKIGVDRLIGPWMRLALRTSDSTAAPDIVSLSRLKTEVNQDHHKTDRSEQSKQHLRVPVRRISPMRRYY